MGSAECSTQANCRPWRTLSGHWQRAPRMPAMIMIPPDCPGPASAASGRLGTCQPERARVESLEWQARGATASPLAGAMSGRAAGGTAGTPLSAGSAPWPPACRCHSGRARAGRRRFMQVHQRGQVVASMKPREFRLLLVPAPAAAVPAAWVEGACRLLSQWGGSFSTCSNALRPLGSQTCF